MTKVLIKNGHLIDPQNKVDELMDLLIENGQVKKVSKKIAEKDVKIIDAQNMYVLPGLIDLQVHLREPGREDKETIETGLRAAIAGGITSVVTMPNTTPVCDNQSVVEFQIRRAEKLGLANLFPSGAITKKQEGKELAEIKEMKNSGAVAITEDGGDVQYSHLMEKAMEWARTFDLPVFCHSEREDLHDHGIANEGSMSIKLGLSPVSREVEDLGIARNIALAQKTGARLHLLHLSTGSGAEIIRQAKKTIKNLTVETCPQYFALNDEILEGYNTFAKMYPPIRGEADRQAIIKHLKNGTIDCISTDHAPHILMEKWQSFADATFGSSGLETSLALSYTYLVKNGPLTISELVEKMSKNPARVLQMPNRGHLGIGAMADITIFNPNKSWTVDPAKFESKGKNCVFLGMKVFGKADTVLVAGKIKMDKEKIMV